MTLDRDLHSKIDNLCRDAGVERTSQVEGYIRALWDEMGSPDAIEHADMVADIRMAFLEDI